MMNCKCTLACLAALLLAVMNLPAQFVEVEAIIDVTSWRYDEGTGLPLKNSRSFSVRCVVGTNTWLIESQSQTNLKQSAWFAEGKIIRQNTVTLNQYANQDPISDESEYLPTRRGGRSVNIVASSDGYPGNDMFLSLPWFAFCSGPYFRHPGRSVPLPAPPTGRGAFGFADESTLFRDNLGLPQRVDLLTAKREIKCEYRVQQFTNALGWSFPTAFTVVQNEPDGFNVWKRQITATGSVTRIRRASRPELPEEIQMRLEMLDQFPTRRRR